MGGGLVNIVVESNELSLAQLAHSIIPFFLADVISLKREREREREREKIKGKG